MGMSGRSALRRSTSAWPPSAPVSDGMSAADAIVRLLKSGEHIVSVDDVYGGTSRLFDQVVSKGGIEVTYVDTTQPEPGLAVRQVQLPQTSEMLVEFAACQLRPRQGEALVPLVEGAGVVEPEGLV